MTDGRFSVTPFKVSGTNLTSGRQRVFLFTRQYHAELCILSGLHVTHTYLFCSSVKILAFKVKHQEKPVFTVCESYLNKIFLVFEC